MKNNTRMKLLALSMIGAISTAQADDLVCDKCVNTKDIAKGAVKTSKLRNGAVTTSKIKDGSIKSVDIQVDQVVKGLNGLKDEVTIVGGEGITVTTEDNSIVIDSSSSESSQWQDYSNHIYYTDGNVGIGTNNPSTLLHLNGDSGTVNPFYLQTIETNRVGGDFIQGIRNDGTEAFSINQDGNNHSHMYIRDGSENIKVRIHSAAPTYFNGGNVGIGTESPVSKLAVKGLPTSAPDSSGNAGVVCSTNEGNFWLDNDGTADCQ